MSRLSPFNEDGTVKRVEKPSWQGGELPTDADMIDWLDKHPEITVGSLGKLRRVSLDRVNGWAVNGANLRVVLERAMQRYP